MTEPDFTERRPLLYKGMVSIMKVTENENKRLPFLRDKTAKLTLSPGCYIMKNEKGKIIYIGKAKSLRKRVTSYFRASADHLPKVAKMISLLLTVNLKLLF